MASLASSWNFIYGSERLKKDPRWYEKNILGSGPFIFGEYIAGSHRTGKRKPNYFMAGRPYLDGFRAVFIRDTAPRVAAVKSGQVLAEFSGYNRAARDDIGESARGRGDRTGDPLACNNLGALTNEKKPFNDVRVGRALNLAIDRNEGVRGVVKI